MKNETSTDSEQAERSAWKTALGGAPNDREQALPVLQRLQAQAGPQYQCPGESELISRAVHLSRQARFYPACRDCPHADVPAVPCETTTTGQVVTARRVVTSGSVPGAWRKIYLNEFDRSDAEKLALSIAAEFWRAHPRRARTDDDVVLNTRTETHGPDVVVARDFRPSSADIACGVVRGLRRMGCRVTELGVVCRPTMDFAVYHLRSAGGVFITGAGGDAATTGVDVIGEDGVPWSQPGRLSALGDWRRAPVSRESRKSGTVQLYDLAAAERTDLSRHFHGLRQGRLGIIFDDPRLAAESARWWDGSGCEVTTLTLPGIPFGATELPVDARRQLRTTVQSQSLSMVARIADDARQVQLFDELARPIDPADCLLRLAEAELAAQGSGTIVLDSLVPGAVRGRLRAHGARLEIVDETEETLVAGLATSDGLLAADGRGRIWFRDHYPVCHGLITVARLWRVAMELEQPLRHWSA
ncbi:MAG: hypothetical protein ACK5Q5_12055 [Planctomycetaceae bacterium]